MHFQTILVSFTGFLTASCSAKAITLPVPRALSPDNTCGLQNSGQNNGYTCPSSLPCCSPSGFCGSGDAYCLTTIGCQSQFSNTTGACYMPTDGQTTTPDNTCGKTGAGLYGYRCNMKDLRCCSQYGYCGNTTDYCQIVNGCQRGYGFCVPNDA
ncbi:hypothetical protein BGZ60DRAFT_433743 [Tricladium varicosporioides]|nr:hypothetical protein BGZ60DRAFT_433743 [Hymenoscyphus varicosporioides]